MNKPIPGHPDYLASPDGRIYSEKSRRYLSLSNCNQFGYFQVQLWRNGTKVTKKVHRLIAQAFIPNPKKLPFINHKDGNKWNNHVRNLEWCTNAENQAHAKKLGLNAFGERHGGAKLTEKQVLKIRDLYAAGNQSYRKLAKRFGVSAGTICAIVRRKLWTQI